MHVPNGPIARIFTRKTRQNGNRHPLLLGRDRPDTISLTGSALSHFAIEIAIPVQQLAQGVPNGFTSIRRLVNTPPGRSWQRFICSCGSAVLARAFF
jgi:hypothetical protein